MNLLYLQIFAKEAKERMILNLIKAKQRRKNVPASK